MSETLESRSERSSSSKSSNPEMEEGAETPFMRRPGRLERVVCFGADSLDSGSLGLSDGGRSAADFSTSLEGAGSEGLDSSTAGIGSVAFSTAGSVVVEASVLGSSDLV